MPRKSYYDLDEILAGETKIPVTFNVDVVNLGYLNPTSGKDDIEKDTHLELSFWLAEQLFNEGVVTLYPPRFYCGDYEYLSVFYLYRKILRAPSVNLELRNLCPYYFSVGRDIGFILDRNLVNLLRMYRF